jgi:hypothetical protein
MTRHLIENLSDEELENRLRAFGYQALADSLEDARRARHKNPPRF